MRALRLVQSLLALATEVPEGPHALRSAQLFHTISWMTSLSTLSAYLLRCEVAPVLVEVFMSVGNDGPIPFAGYARARRSAETSGSLVAARSPTERPLQRNES